MVHFEQRLVFYTSSTSQHKTSVFFKFRVKKEKQSWLCQSLTKFTGSKNLRRCSVCPWDCLSVCHGNLAHTEKILSDSSKGHYQPLIWSEARAKFLQNNPFDWDKFTVIKLLVFTYSNTTHKSSSEFLVNYLLTRDGIQLLNVDNWRPLSFRSL